MTQITKEILKEFIIENRELFFEEVEDKSDDDFYFNLIKFITDVSDILYNKFSKIKIDEIDKYTIKYVEATEKLEDFYRGFVESISDNAFFKSKIGTGKISQLPKNKDRFIGCLESVFDFLKKINNIEISSLDDKSVKEKFESRDLLKYQFIKEEIAKGATPETLGNIFSLSVSDLAAKINFILRKISTFKNNVRFSSLYTDRKLLASLYEATNKYINKNNNEMLYVMINSFENSDLRFNALLKKNIENKEIPKEDRDNFIMKFRNRFEYLIGGPSIKIGDNTFEINHILEEIIKNLGIIFDKIKLTEIDNVEFVRKISLELDEIRTRDIESLVKLFNENDIFKSIVPQFKYSVFEINKNPINEYNKLCEFISNKLLKMLDPGKRREVSITMEIEDKLKNKIDNSESLSKEFFEILLKSDIIKSKKHDINNIEVTSFSNIENDAKLKFKNVISGVFRKGKDADYISNWTNIAVNFVHDDKKDETLKSIKTLLDEWTGVYFNLSKMHTLFSKEEKDAYVDLGDSNDYTSGKGLIHKDILTVLEFLLSKIMNVDIGSFLIKETRAVKPTEETDKEQAETYDRIKDEFDKIEFSISDVKEKKGKSVEASVFKLSSSGLSHIGSEDETKKKDKKQEDDTAERLYKIYKIDDKYHIYVKSRDGLYIKYGPLSIQEYDRIYRFLIEKKIEFRDVEKDVAKIESFIGNNISKYVKGEAGEKDIITRNHLLLIYILKIFATLKIMLSVYNIFGVLMLKSELKK